MSTQIVLSTAWAQTTLPTATIERLLRLLFDDRATTRQAVAR